MTETRIEPPKGYRSKLPAEPLGNKAIPPMMLVPTASPFVYISQPALSSSQSLVLDSDEYGDYDDDDFDDLDPSTLFAEAVTKDSTSTTATQQYIPPIFSNGRFHYFSRPSLTTFSSSSPPEVAFLGRSNVGKSSLINALMGQNLCQTSKSPGRTQRPYYYGLVPDATNSKTKHHPNKTISDNKQLSPPLGYIVDLPGYGYGATAPKHVVEAWQSNTQDWLLHKRRQCNQDNNDITPSLRRVYLLLDSRRVQPSELDLSVMSWLEEAMIPYTIVLTKADRVSVPQVVRQANDVCLRYAAIVATIDASAGDDHLPSTTTTTTTTTTLSPVVHITSSSRGWGITELMLSVEAEFHGDNDDE